MAHLRFQQCGPIFVGKQCNRQLTIGFATHAKNVAFAPVVAACARQEPGPLIREPQSAQTAILKWQAFANRQSLFAKPKSRHTRGIRTVTDHQQIGTALRHRVNLLAEVCGQLRREFAQVGLPPLPVAGHTMQVPSAAQHRSAHTVARETAQLHACVVAQHDDLSLIRVAVHGPGGASEPSVPVCIVAAPDDAAAGLVDAYQHPVEGLFSTKNEVIHSAGKTMKFELGDFEYATVDDVDEACMRAQALRRVGRNEPGEVAITFNLFEAGRTQIQGGHGAGGRHPSAKLAVPCKGLQQRLTARG